MTVSDGFMKKLSDYLPIKGKIPNKRKQGNIRKDIDEKTIFFLAEKVISSQYGTRGRENISPKFWKDGKLFFLSQNSLWAGEVWVNRESIRAKINAEIGNEMVLEIKVSEIS